jgi:dTDP-4-dehydrorhamnose 3,5-epimerase
MLFDMAANRTETIAGVTRRTLPDSRDARGDLVELVRDEWFEGLRATQWNVVRSSPGVLRGVHWHERRADLISSVAGRVALGLVDLRRGSPTEGAAEIIELDGDQPELVIVPTGVGHGLLSLDLTIVLYGMSEAYDPDDEFSVAAFDPALGIDWPVASAVLSCRDLDAPALDAVERLPRWSGSEPLY